MALDGLITLTANRTGTGKRAITGMVREAIKAHAAEQAEEAQRQKLAERNDPRPQVDQPRQEAPILGVLEILDDVLAKAEGPLPPGRLITGIMTRVREMIVPGTHAFSTSGANALEPESDASAAPKQWALQTLNEYQLAEMLEEYIEFVKKGEAVRLQDKFVRHYLEQSSRKLPTYSAIATLPIVLADGVMLVSDGLDRERGIAFMIPDAIRTTIPSAGECGDDAIADAMEFLTEEWLCDVATDYVGKCVIVAMTLTLIERSLLDARPVFFITAGQRGNGKTTTTKMVTEVVTGQETAATQWSPNEDERRKVLTSQFMLGVPYIAWDNIQNGLKIKCPSIERSCTVAMWADRKLGVSEMVRTAATTIHIFTGNNVGAKGDLASRALTVRLQSDRPDPENRKFRHPDPMQWQRDHRAEIMRAMYTILLGNPMLRAARDAACRTRFKIWWRLIGSAIEHAAALCEQKVDFKQLFLEQEEVDEEVTSLTDALMAMRKEWDRNDKGKATRFKASDVAELLNRGESPTIRDFLYERMPREQMVTARSVGKRLEAYVDRMVQVGEHILTLKREPARLEGREKLYYINKRKVT